MLLPARHADVGGTRLPSVGPRPTPLKSPLFAGKYVFPALRPKQRLTSGKALPRKLLTLVGLGLRPAAELAAATALVPLPCSVLLALARVVGLMAGAAEDVALRELG